MFTFIEVLHSRRINLRICMACNKDIAHKMNSKMSTHRAAAPFGSNNDPTCARNFADHSRFCGSVWQATQTTLAHRAVAPFASNNDPTCATNFAGHSTALNFTWSGSPLFHPHDAKSLHPF